MPKAIDAACRQCGRSDQMYRVTPGVMVRRLVGQSLQPDGQPDWQPDTSRATFRCDACGNQGQAYRAVFNVE